MLTYISQWYVQIFRFSDFLLSYGNQAIYIHFLKKILQKTHKSSFFSYKQVSVRNDDHEWLRMANDFILCDLLWNVQKSRAANREDSFNISYASAKGFTPKGKGLSLHYKPEMSVYFTSMSLGFMSSSYSIIQHNTCQAIT